MAWPGGAGVEANHIAQLVYELWVVELAYAVGLKPVSAPDEPRPEAKCARLRAVARVTKHRAERIMLSSSPVHRITPTLPTDRPCAIPKAKAQCEGSLGSRFARYVHLSWGLWP